MAKRERIDEFVVGRLLEVFGQEVWNAAIDEVSGKFMLKTPQQRVNKARTHATKAVCNYFANKQIDPTSINTQ